MSKKLKVILTIFGVTVLTGGVAAGAALLLPKLIKKHADLGMTKAEVLKKLGDPDHTSESGDYWYYFESKVGKKYKEKDELEHTWNEANQIKAQSIGLQLETEHFESKTIHFNKDNFVISYFYNTDTKYTYENEKLSSWSEKNSTEITTDFPSGMKCYINSVNKDGVNHYLIGDDNFKNSFNYEAMFEDKSLIKFANETSFDIVGPKNNINVEWKYDDLKLSTKINFKVYDARVVATTEAKNVYILGNGFYNIGDNVELRAEISPGYISKGWDTDVRYSFGTRSSIHLTDESIYKFDVENYGKKEFEFLTDLEVYTITYNLNGGINSSSNPSTFTVEDEIVLSDPTRNNYNFVGWYDENENKVTSICSGTTSGLDLFARWIPAKYNLSVTSDDAFKGTVTITEGVGCYGESITVKAIPADDYLFNGWYSGSTKVSDSLTYSFIMPASDYALVAHFISKAEKEEEELAQKYATIPLFSNDEKTITYGLYPQTVVNNTSLVDELNQLTTPESNGWYLYKGNYYAKFNATPRISQYHTVKFENGTVISNGATYWFMCEPIVWNILNNNDGEYFVISSVLLDTHYYYNSISERTIDGKTVYPNNYKYSDIRTWLNDEFYNSAFRLGYESIQNTLVDNSAATTNYETNMCACENTIDKVFLPSYKDYVNSNYGFSASNEASNTRLCRTTDWARARGSNDVCISGKTYNSNYYWTRSPSYPFSNVSDMVRFNGSIAATYDETVDSTYVSVRPAITIKK